MSDKDSQPIRNVMLHLGMIKIANKTGNAHPAPVIPKQAEVVNVKTISFFMRMHTVNFRIKIASISLSRGTAITICTFYRTNFDNCVILPPEFYNSVTYSLPKHVKPKALTKTQIQHIDEVIQGQILFVLLDTFVNYFGTICDRC